MFDLFSMKELHKLFLQRNVFLFFAIYLFIINQINIYFIL